MSGNGEIELVLDRKTGQVRQAGSDGPGKYVADFKKAAEQSLFTFLVGVLGRNYLTKRLHKPWCDSLQTIPPRRKLRLYPRHHGKTSIVSHGLPVHMLIQPEDGNIYFPGRLGADTTILLAGETESLASKNLRVIAGAFESNEILRALWPHVIWADLRQSKKWNEIEMIVRRQTDYPEPSVMARGVGGAITGLHPHVLIKDDLISFDASNSETVMQTAIQWHIASRGLIEGNPEAIEVIVGTRWSPFDLYRYIIERDPLMDTEIRGALEDGQPIYPERFDLETLDRLRKEFGALYPLLYLNTAIGAAVTDFDMAELRSYTIEGDTLIFDPDERDALLAERRNGRPMSQIESAVSSPTGRPETMESRREDYLRWRHRSP